jgi:hypothetical protein
VAGQNGVQVLRNTRHTLRQARWPILLIAPPPRRPDPRRVCAKVARRRLPRRLWAMEIAQAIALSAVIAFFLTVSRLNFRGKSGGESPPLAPAFHKVAWNNNLAVCVDA